MGALSYLYKRLFARKFLYPWHEKLYHMSLYGMGVLNYENDIVSGEDYFLRRFAHWGHGRTLTVFDVGANRGDYTRKLLKYCPDARIYAFEPHPITFAFLQAHCGTASAINKGCSDTNGSMTIYDYADDDGSSHASLYAGALPDGRRTQHTIDCITLDSFIDAQQISHIDLLKVDTEGHELTVLKGATQALANKTIAMIQFEFNEMNVHSRAFFHDIGALLPHYTFYRLLQDALIPLGPYKTISHEIFAFQNIVAIADTADNFL